MILSPCVGGKCRKFISNGSQPSGAEYWLEVRGPKSGANSTIVIWIMRFLTHG